MICDVSGKVTFVEHKATKDNQNYLVVKVMQADNKGNVNTIPVRIWDAKMIMEGFKVGDDVIVEGCVAKPYKSGLDRVGMSVDKW